MEGLLENDSVLAIFKEGLWAQWHTPVIPVPGRLGQEDRTVETRLGNLAKSCLKK